MKQQVRIVWDGYKSIIEAVRVNQKLEQVYMDTLSRVFEFVEKYDRKYEFQELCKFLRAGLQNAVNNRVKTEQQKTSYINIEKTEVNDRNI